MPQCPTCSKSLSTKQGVRHHHNSVHGESLVHEEGLCEWCDTTFTYHVERDEGRFCSQDCYQEWLHQVHLSGEDSPLANKVECVCDECGEPFKVQQSRAELNDGNYCSRSCYHENYTGENAPYWCGGKESYYGSTWLSQRLKAIDRDDEQCQDCGLTRDEHYDEYDRDLEVHHITPIRTFSDTEEANQLPNLITLCKSCHLQRENS